MLLPGDEHPAPGRAPGHRAGSRRRSTWSSCSSRSPRASRCRSPRTRSPAPGTRSRPGSTPRTRSTGSCRRPGVAELVRWSPRARVDAALESGQRVEHLLRPDARQGDRARRHPGGGPPRPGRPRSTTPRSSGLTTNLGFLRGARRDSDEFRDDDDRHRVAGPPPRRGPPARARRRRAWPPGAWRRWPRPTTRTPTHPFGTATAGGSAGPPAPVPVELDRRRRATGSTGGPGRRSVGGAPRCTRSGRRAADDVLRLEVDGRVHEAAVRVGRARGRGRLPRPHVRLRPAGRVRTRRGRGSPTAASPPRCPAPCSRSRRRGAAGRGGRGARRAGGDEDGAVAKAPFAGTVTDGRRGGRRPGGARGDAVRGATVEQAGERRMSGCRRWSATRPARRR